MCSGQDEHVLRIASHIFVNYDRRQGRVYNRLVSDRKFTAIQVKDLAGTWTLVSITTEREGKKIDFYGPNPHSQAMYDANGRVSSIITRSDLPKFASNNRQSGTPEENKAVVQGSIAYFGTYTVDEAAKTVTYHLESCSFPNWSVGSTRC